MRQAVSRGLWAAVFLLLPSAVFAETTTYYDCMNEDGSMSYRVFPCSEGQEEIRRQKNSLSDLKEGEDDDAEPANQPARLISPPEASARQNFAAGEAANTVSLWKNS